MLLQWLVPLSCFLLCSRIVFGGPLLLMFFFPSEMKGRKFSDECCERVVAACPQQENTKLHICPSLPNMRLPLSLTGHWNHQPVIHRPINSFIQDKGGNSFGHSQRKHESLLLYSSIKGLSRCSLCTLCLNVLMRAGEQTVVFQELSCWRALKLWPLVGVLNAAPVWSSLQV